MVVHRLWLVWLIGGLSWEYPYSQSRTGHDFIVTNNGAWTWFNDERAVMKDDRLYTSYIRNDGYVALSVNDMLTGEHIGTEVVLSTWKEADDHNNASILLRSDGKIMTFYSRHGTVSNHSHRISLIDKPIQQGEWGAEVTETTSGLATYNTSFQLSAEDGKIYRFMRTANKNPNWKEYHAQGYPLSEERVLISNPSHNPYVKYTSNNIDRIDFFFTHGHPGHENTHLYHFYYKADAFYQTDGVLIKYKSQAPVFPDEVNKVYVFGSSALMANPWVHSINSDRHGNPVVTYSAQVDMQHVTYQMARWDRRRKQWMHRFVADAGDGLYAAEPDYTGLLVTNPTNVNEVFMSSNVNPSSGTVTAHYEIYVGKCSNKGKSIKWSAITENSSSDNLRPFVPKGADDGHQVLLWLRGNYRTYKDYNMMVVGRFITKRHMAGKKTT